MSRRWLPLDWGLGFLLAGLLLAFPVRQGWTRVETDFPNYYSAAVAARDGQPLEKFYDWTWFQREMNFTGTERQLGAYVPQSPLALLPFLPLAGLPPQQAKQVWLSLNLVMLAATIFVLAQSTGLPYRWLFAILLAGFGSLASNFVLGQYYVLLTFLLALSIASMSRGRSLIAGLILSTIFALKVYAAPFALFFLVKRRRWPLAGFVLGTVLFAAVSIAWFGWQANLMYVEGVVPSLMSGMLIDPYHPGHGSVVVGLRHLMVAEPELNPHPWVDAPRACAFLQMLFVSGVLTLMVFILKKRREFPLTEFAWAVIGLLLLAPINATYVFTLLVVPAALLFSGMTMAERVAMLASLVLMGAPLPQHALGFFPRAWVLAGLFFWFGRTYLRALSRKEALWIAGIATAAAAAAVAIHREGDGKEFERLVQPGYSIAAISPTIGSRGLVYQGFGDGRYVLYSGGTPYAFEGHALHPASSPLGAKIFFELVAERHSRLWSFDPETRVTEAITDAALNAREPSVAAGGESVTFQADGRVWIRDARGTRSLGVAGSEPSFSSDGAAIVFARDGRLSIVNIDSHETKEIVSVDGIAGHPAMSPDGRMLAFTVQSHGVGQVWWKTLPEGKPRQLTSARCNHSSPAWEGDSHHLIFTSDCGRGLGLPGLYRAGMEGR